MNKGEMLALLKGPENAERLRGIAAAFSEFLFDPVGDLAPLNPEKMLDYLIDPRKFSLEIERKRGAGVLYGRDHVRIRREVLNGLPDEVRAEIVREKLAYADILGYVAGYLGTSVGHVKKVEDIGMGHSVYAVGVKGGSERSVVVKEKRQQAQVFYCDLLRELGWPSYKTVHLVNQVGQWEITDYLGSQNLNDFLVQNCELTTFEDALAAHAALGDVLGRGDRHFENYITRKDSVFPLDISFLFSLDNEIWTRRYVAGGVYEICFLKRYRQDEGRLQEHLQRFWHNYGETLANLSKSEEVFNSVLSRHFWGIDRGKAAAFVLSRLHDLPSLFLTEKNVYMAGFQEMLNREIYKETLDKIAVKAPELLKKLGLLRMYYLADRGRPSTFLYSEERYQQVYPEIETLAESVLGLSRAVFEDHRKWVSHLSIAW